MKPTWNCNNLPLLKWSLEAGSKREPIPTDLHVKMPNFTADKKTCIQLGTKTVLVSIANFVLHGESPV